MVQQPRVVALSRADEFFGLPEGTAARWMGSGRVRRVFFLDHGTPVAGVRTVEVRHAMAQDRAAQIRVARQRSNDRTLGGVEQAQPRKAAS